MECAWPRRRAPRTVAATVGVPTGEAIRRLGRMGYSVRLAHSGSLVDHDFRHGRATVVPSNGIVASVIVEDFDGEVREYLQSERERFTSGAVALSA
jgi:hypothetical protein